MIDNQILRSVGHSGWFPGVLVDATYRTAEQLYLSRDTVKHHIQHIYDKISVSTRATATLFAMENALI